jgi:hypothetical protein
VFQAIYKNNFDEFWKIPDITARASRSVCCASRNSVVFPEKKGHCVAM